MPAKKKNQTSQQETPEETPETQAQAFDRLSTNLTSTFEKGFEKLQHALLNMARPQTSDAADGTAAKRQAEEATPGPNTRNKALRSVYNPTNKSGEEIQPPTKKSKAKPRNAKPSADAMDVDNSDVTCTATTSGGHVAFPNVNNMPSGRNSQYAMNDWLINEAPKHKGGFTFNTLPTSAAAIPTDSHLEAQVQNVLLNTASHLAKGNVQQGLYPHKYVLRGPEQKRMGLNALNPVEYLGGIFKMIKDPVVPSNIKPYLYAHMEEIVEDAADYDWQTAVRPWSEEVFTLIAEGRLPEGWSSHEKIQMLRLTISRASTAKLHAQNAQHNNTQPRYRQTAGSANQSNESLRGGSPCINFNSPQGCQLQPGHFVNGKKLLHICAFCLWNSATPHPHPECYCRNKQRFNAQGHF